MRFIYGLHAGDSITRYVGQTSDMESRLKSITDLSRKQGLLSFWVSINAGKVEMFEVEKCKDEMADISERFWIDYYKNEGFPLVNMEGGGRDRKRESSLRLLKKVKLHWNSCKIQPSEIEMNYLKELVRQQKYKVGKPRRRSRK